LCFGVTEMPGEICSQYVTDFIDVRV